MDHEEDPTLHAPGLTSSYAPSIASNDPLAHPLLSPTPSTSDSLSSTRLQPNSQTAAPSPPRYVPYTPRQQRPVGTTISSSVALPSSPSSQAGGPTATGKLQLQSLKAAVQLIGLDNSSVGWIILEKLVSGEIEGHEWDAVWNLIADGQVCVSVLVWMIWPLRRRVMTR